MTGRYSVRKAIEARASLACERHVVEGRVLDLSVPGCLLDTGLQLHVRHMVQLRLTSATGTSVHISLAVVRWVHGRRAGLELIRMSDIRIRPVFGVSWASLKSDRPPGRSG